MYINRELELKDCIEIEDTNGDKYDYVEDNVEHVLKMIGALLDEHNLNLVTIDIGAGDGFGIAIEKKKDHHFF